MNTVNCCGKGVEMGLCGLFLLLSRLHPWLMASVHFDHISSISCGAFQYCGSVFLISSFNCITCSSVNGKPGFSACPCAVHRTITSSPKKHSHASNNASVPTLPSLPVRCKLFLIIKAGGFSLALSIKFCSRHWFECWCWCHH